MPARVLHIVKSLGLGGTQKVMQLFVTRLDPDRYTAAVHSPADGERGSQLRAAGIPTYIGPDVEKTLLLFRPDIIHVHRAGWPEPRLMRPLILYARARPGTGVVETNVFGRHDPSVWGQAVHVTLFVSQFCRDRYGALQRIPCAAPRYQVLYNPVDAAFLQARCAAPAERDFSRPVAGRVSRPDPGKWSALAWTFLPAVCAACPEFEYRIVGAIPAAAKFVRAHGLERHVRFHDPLVSEQDLAGFLDGLSLFLHANDTGESFGLSIAEAMAAGLPVVTHACPFPRDNAQTELVEHGRTGLVASTADEYAQAVLWLLRHPEEARRMGRAGQEKARTQYAAPRIAARLMAVYDEIRARLRKKET